MVAHLDMCYGMMVLLLVRDRANIVLQFFGLQLDRGNLQNALTDNLLGDLRLSK